MHWQAEAWRCAEGKLTSTGTSSANGTVVESNGANKPPRYSKTINQCPRVFYRREQFQAHLHSDHKIDDEDYVHEQCRLRRIGRYGQKGFWCGFCQTVISLKKQGLEAFDERFTHINSKHFDNGERVENWFPLDKELPKGLLDAPPTDLEKEEEELEGEVSDVPDGQHSGSDEENDAEMLTTAPLIPAGHVHIQRQAKALRTADVDAPRSDPGKTWYCVSPGPLIAWLPVSFKLVLDANAMV